ncbi:MAG: hypothetical protein U0K57_02880 [Lachnospiraceae bacterium]|nr:hypothetical protein [Lachnospiraceae bacterium]
MNFWDTFDASRTIRSFDYTKRAVRDMNYVLDSKDFENKDSEMIFQYLTRKMELVSFRDYLKRYIYEKAQLDMDFDKVPEDLYLEILSSSFTDNLADQCFSHAAKKNATLKRWLSQESVRRNVIFQLGFGLNMSAADVSLFLTNVIKEEDFNFSDETEAIYWFCFQHGLRYPAAMSLLDQYAILDIHDSILDFNPHEVSSTPELFLSDKEMLLKYLTYLKRNQVSEQDKDNAYQIFLNLYDRTRKILADIFSQDNVFPEMTRTYTVDEIGPREVESVICSGIPLSRSGNLVNMNQSTLSRQFRKQRLSRQRIDRLLKQKNRVDRFDIITLLFFIYAETVQPDFPAERVMEYIDQINDLLTQCNMSGIYPVNPYEAFVLMCLLSEEPLAVYSEVWERSFEESSSVKL